MNEKEIEKLKEGLLSVLFNTIANPEKIKKVQPFNKYIHLTLEDGREFKVTVKIQ